jgi:hypothetical protein
MITLRLAGPRVLLRLEPDDRPAMSDLSDPTSASGGSTTVAAAVAGLYDEDDAHRLAIELGGRSRPYPVLRGNSVYRHAASISSRDGLAGPRPRPEAHGSWRGICSRARPPPDHDRPGGLECAIRAYGRSACPVGVLRI